MNFFTFFIISVVLCAIFDWIIKKTDICNKIFSKSRKHKYTRTILVLMLLLFTFSIEYGKQLLKERYGQHSYVSIIIGAFLISIYMNFSPYIFTRNKS